MICPKCGYTESNHVETKSDKEKYLDFWGFQMGTPEAEEDKIDNELIRKKRS